MSKKEAEQEAVKRALEEMGVLAADGGQEPVAGSQ